MGENFKFTLYELFGYLLPGSVCTGALLLVDWTFLHRFYDPRLLENPRKTIIVALGAIAYLLGHAIQSLANSILPSFTASIINGKRFRDTRELMVKVNEDLNSKYKNLSANNVIAICEQEFQNRGPSGEREIYVYREGFYRGMLVALFTLVLCLILILLAPKAFEVLSRHGVYKREIWFVILLCTAASYGMYRRAQRFANYRIVQALISHLIVAVEGGSIGRSGT